VSQQHANQSQPPVVCDMSAAPDTPVQRAREYRRLFSRALTGRERSEAGIRFRFRADPGVAEWVRDLAEREKACCAFFTFTVTDNDREVWWEASVIDDESARRVLAEFYRLPETLDAIRAGSWPGPDSGC
jgi:hypothetical protein